MSGTTLYAVVRTDTGECLCGEAWGEEPEWFNAAEAAAILRASPIPLRIRAQDFSPTEYQS